MPPPDSPPDRTTADHYHYHVYDYEGSKPWTLSPQLRAPDGPRFYSLAQDLTGLLQTGGDNRVPNIHLQHIGGVAAEGGTTMALSFGGPASPSDDTPEVVITGGIHAREWVAAEMAYLLGEYLIKNHPPNGDNLTPRQNALKALINSRRIHIIPMVNPSGNQYSVTSDDKDARLWRKNRRALPRYAKGWRKEIADRSGWPHPPFEELRLNQGAYTYDVPKYAPPHVPPGKAEFKSYLLETNATGVDLNRNFDTRAWGYNCGPDFMNAYPSDRTYFGPSAGSEVETRNIMEYLALRQSLGTSIDYHSYGRYIVYPSEPGYRGDVDRNYRNLGEILKRLIAPAPNRQEDYYTLGSSLDLFEYDATGTLADYAATINHARAFTIELDPGGKKGTAGFLLNETEIQRVFEENLRGALGLIMAAGERSTLRTDRRFCCFGRRTTITSGESAFLKWKVYGRGNRLPA